MMGGLMTDVGKQLHQTSIANKQAFWQQAAKALEWVTPSKQILDESEAPFYHWFSDGELNTCYNAIDRHVLAGRGEQIAIHYVSPVTETEYSITYHEIGRAHV